jgi:hypothetical protein
LKETAMPTSDIQEQLVKYLTDAHSIEVQALVQMKAAPRMAGTEELARMYEQHERETEDHKRLIEERLEAHGTSPSKIKDVVMGAGAVPLHPVCQVAAGHARQAGGARALLRAPRVRRI